MKAQMFTVAAVTATLVACASAAAPGAPKGPTATAVPATASATAAQPSPTAVPPPPLAILDQGNLSVSAVDAAGRIQWTLASTALARLLSGRSNDGFIAQAAGPNVVVTGTTGPYGHQVGHLVVLDRHGTQIGGGTFVQTAANGDSFVVPAASPTGTEWAWSVEDGSTPNIHGRVLVDGLGEAPHSVFSWVLPAGSYGENVAAWTDMGIVLERITNSGCGIGFHFDSASFLIDPASGTLTGLFDGNSYGDASRGVRVAFSRSAGAVTVNGTTFDEHNSVATHVQVSPDGATVGVQRFVAGGCGAESRLSTELIDVATGTHTDISGCGFNGWFDSKDFVCSPFRSQTQTLETVDGRALATLGNGVFAGATSG